MSRRGKPEYRRILGVLGPFRAPWRGKGGVSVEQPGILEGCGTSRTTYTTPDKEWR
jgi:hypothetical protein